MCSENTNDFMFNSFDWSCGMNMRWFHFSSFDCFCGLNTYWFPVQPLQVETLPKFIQSTNSTPWTSCRKIEKKWGWIEVWAWHCSIWPDPPLMLYWATMSMKRIEKSLFSQKGKCKEWINLLHLVNRNCWMECCSMPVLLGPCSLPVATCGEQFGQFSETNRHPATCCLMQHPHN